MFDAPVDGVVAAWLAMIEFISLTVELFIARPRLAI